MPRSKHAASIAANAPAVFRLNLRISTSSITISGNYYFHLPYF
jgi:hypothetical protein